MVLYGALGIILIHIILVIIIIINYLMLQHSPKCKETRVLRIDEEPHKHMRYRKQEKNKLRELINYRCLQLIIGFMQPTSYKRKGS